MKGARELEVWMTKGEEQAAVSFDAMGHSVESGDVKERGSEGIHRSLETESPVLLS